MAENFCVFSAAEPGIDENVKLCYTLFDKGGENMAKMNAQVGIRVTKELKDRMTVQARKEMRSVSAMIIRVMEEYLDQVEQKPSK